MGHVECQMLAFQCVPLWLGESDVHQPLVELTRNAIVPHGVRRLEANQYCPCPINGGGPLTLTSSRLIEHPVEWLVAQARTQHLSFRKVVADCPFAKALFDHHIGADDGSLTSDNSGNVLKRPLDCRWLQNLNR